MWKKNFSCVLWLGLLNLPLALYCGSAYAPDLSSPWFILVAFAFAAIGHFFLYFALGALIFIFPVFMMKRKLGFRRFSYAALVLIILHIILATDAQVFALYRFHLSYAMLDLFINGGGEVISFSSDTWLSILFEAMGIVVYSVAVLGLAVFIAYKGFKARLWVLLAIFMYVLANLINAYASARHVVPLLELQNRIPLYRPLTMNSLLVKMDLISAEDLANRKVAVQENGLFDYPKAPLQYAPVIPESSLATRSARSGEVIGTAPYNVLLIAVDALRGDMLTPEIMPHTYAFAQQAWRYEHHYSSSNSTRGGIFGLFYGLPPSYWQMALNSSIPSVVTQAVQKTGYKYGIFTSANLYKPEFNATVFAGVPNLRLESDVDGGVIERDADAIADFTQFIHELKPEDKFFSFVFLDNVHSYATPEGFTSVFTPDPATINHMALGPDSDPTPVRNRYQNAVYYADQSVAHILELLAQQGLLERTIVIITSDHGEEFNDNGGNYWGHNSNFTDVQMHIPLVIKWPDAQPRVIKTRTSAYDLTATLMPRVFGVTNPVSDFSIGQDLVNPQEPPFILVGSYLENALIEDDRIVLIDKLGILRFKDKRYRDSSNTERDSNLFAALRLMSYYMQGAPRQVPDTTAITPASVPATTPAAIAPAAIAPAATATVAMDPQAAPAVPATTEATPATTEATPASATAVEKELAAPTAAEIAAPAVGTVSLEAVPVEPVNSPAAAEAAPVPAL